MDEYTRQQYLREEDFLEDFYGTVEAVLPQLPRPWQPNFRCNDETRERRRRLLATGQLTYLVFDAAAIFYGREGFSSIGLYLRSSARFVAARIHFPGGEATVETLADSPRKFPCVPQTAGYRGGR